MYMRICAVALLILLIPAGANHEFPHQISPSPTPQPIFALTDERCPKSSRTLCHDLHHHLTACLNTSSSAGASKESFLLVQNDGEDLLKVNVTITDIKTNFPEMQVPKHQAIKIQILANIDGSPSIILHAGHGECIIPITSSGRYSQFYNQYITHLSPIYGAYFLFFTVLIAGGVWACCKIGKNEQNVDGIRYQELEMEQPPSHSANDEEMGGGGWNQDWGDDWEEQVEEKSPNGHQTENVSANSKTSDTNGWGNDWED